MKLRPLVLDAAARDQIQKVTFYAEQHPIDLHTVFRAMNKPERAVGNDPKRCCVLQFGYRCAFSIEHQPLGQCRHLSISVAGEGYAPNPVAIEAIMKEFGFTCSLKDADAVYEETLGKGKAAINIIQKLPNPEPRHAE